MWRFVSIVCARTKTSLVQRTAHNHAYVATFAQNPRYLWWGRQGFSDPNPKAVQAERLITALPNPSPDHPDVVLAAELAQKAVEEDSPRGKTLLGSFYREGIVLEKDTLTALSLFEQAALAGDPMAQCSLGQLKLMLLNDESTANDVLPDPSVVVDEHGNEKAGFVELKSTDGTSSTEATTPAHLIRSVRKARRKAGFSDAQALEFEQHRQRQSDMEREKDRSTAHEWLDKAIEQGNVKAFLVLAQDLIKDNPKRAVELYERAAKEHRSLDAYYNLGLILEQGVSGVDIDLKASFKNFSMAAQLGDPSAQFYMGHLYRTGNFVVEPDQRTAKKYIEMAVAQNHPEALYYYALMHRNGECGLSKSTEQFLHFVSQSADAGHGPALSCLAEMYYKGEHGTNHDYAKALELYMRAGQNGDPSGLVSAASMYFNGHGAEKDHHRAFQIYQDAMVQGSIPAMRNLASMYFYGHGVPTNKKMSEYFMKLADEAEHEESAKQNTLPPVMTAPIDEDPSAIHLRNASMTERTLQREGRS